MWTLLVHLRLHFQLLLAPVFLWGWLLAGGGLSLSVVLGFIAFHFFLYSGATAFNSYYDRDVGPVGGLERPPSVSPGLLPFSLIVQLIGALLVGGGLLAQALAVSLWASRYDPSQTIGNYRRVMRLNTLTAAALATYLTVRLAI